MGAKKHRSRKIRRRSGRVYPATIWPSKLLDEEGIEITYDWDDWGDYRDGFRAFIERNRLKWKLKNNKPLNKWDRYCLEYYKWLKENKTSKST